MREGLRWAPVLASFVAITATAFGQDGEIESRTEMKVEVKQIPFETKYEFSREVGPGRLVKAQTGVPGEIRQVYKLTFAGNGPVRKVLDHVERVEPVAEVFHMGKSGYQTSRGNFVRGKVLTMKATAYDPSAGRGRHATFRTCTGMRAEYGVVAVDPRIIPLNTLVYVEGYGLAIASDRGSAIKGNRIDLCLNTNSEANRFGRKTVKVHILKAR